MSTGTELGFAVKILTPLVKSVYEGAKAKGINYFHRWNAAQFPKRLSARIVAIELVKTIWQFDKEVPLSSFYYPTKLINKFNSPKPQGISSLRDLPPAPIIIEGIIGQGKSMFIRYLCLQELSKNGSGKLPIFIEMRSIRASSNLFFHIAKQLALYEIDFPDDAFDYLARDGKIALLLDGFDELDSSLASAVAEDLQALIEKYAQIQIVVSSRPDCEIQKVPRFAVFQIAPLTNDDYISFLEKIENDRNKANDIVMAIESSPTEVSGLITTPLMLTLVALVYHAGGEIPPELDLFYDKLFWTVFTRHDKTKLGFARPHKTGLDERRLQILFEAFCYQCARYERTRTITAEQFFSTFEKAVRSVKNESCTADQFRHDLSKVACFLLEEGLGDLTFLHKSIAEYFSASFVKRAHESGAQRFYESAAREQKKWREVLAFLAKIDQYRFYKYFLIPEHTKLVSDITGCERLPDDAVLIEFIKRRFASSEVYSTVDPHLANLFPGNPDFAHVRIPAFENMSISEEIVYSEFRRTIRHRKIRPLSRFKNNWVERPVQREFSSDAYSTCESFIKIFDEIGYKNIAADIKVGLNRLYQDLDMAEKFLKIEDAKEFDVFDLD